MIAAARVVCSSPCSPCRVLHEAAIPPDMYLNRPAASGNGRLYAVTIKATSVNCFTILNVDDSRPREGDTTPHEINRTDSGYGRDAGAFAYFCNRVQPPEGA